MEIHRILGDKGRLYRRADGGNWHCSTYLDGKEWRKSTKLRSLGRAKDVAEDWYLELCAKKRFGELESGKTFAQAAKQFEKSTKRSPVAGAAPSGCRATKTGSGFIYYLTSKRCPLRASPPAPLRNTV